MAASYNKTELQASHDEVHDEKKSETASTTATATVTNDSHRAFVKRNSVDEAYLFLHQLNSASSDGQCNADARSLRRKIDKHILPILWFLFFFHYLDKYLLSYAIVMGLVEDLNLRGNQLNDCVSAISWSYLAMTVIVPIALNKAPIGKWVGINMICWGAMNACVAGVKGYGGLLACRILMGVFDASLPPGLMLLSSQYYRKDEQALRFAFWFSSIGPGIITGGLVSFGFQNVHSELMASWRIMFLTLGLLSALVGVLAVLFLPDTPMNARFLSTSEKKITLQHVAVNGTGVSNHHFEISQLKAVFEDPQIWLLFLSIVIASVGTGILAAYGTTLILSFGFNSKEAALLNLPAGGIAFVSIILFAYLIRYNLLSRFWSTMIGLSLSLVGACLIAFMPHSNRAGQLVGLWMVTFAAATIGIKYQWLAANVGGHTKRSISTVLLSAAVALGSIIGPYTMRPQDKPDYHPAKLILLASNAAAIGLIVILALYYRWANKRRDYLYGTARDTVTADNDSETWANLTDQERKGFRYVM